MSELNYSQNKKFETYVTATKQMVHDQQNLTVEVPTDEHDSQPVKGL